MRFILLFTSIFFISTGWAQNDYEYDREIEPGLIVIKKYSASGKEYRYGLKNKSEKKLILPVKYRYIYSATGSALLVIKDTLNKVGLIARSGKILVEPTYREIRTHFGDYAVVVSDGIVSYSSLFGLIDKNGKLVIPLEYDFLGDYRDGLLNYRKDGKYGFIDLGRNVVIEAKYNNASNFGNGLAPVNSPEGKYGYINKKEEWVIEPKYAGAEDFYDGYARVYSTRRINTTSGRPLVVNDTTGIIDKNGKLVIPLEYNYITPKQEGGFFRAEKGDRATIIDSTGKLLMPLEKQTISYFNKGRAEITRAGKKGLINSKGEIILPIQYDYLTILDDGAVITRKNGQVGVIDSKLKNIISPDSAYTILHSKNNFVKVTNKSIKIFSRVGKLLKEIKEESIVPNLTTLIQGGDSLRFRIGKKVSFKDISSGMTHETSYDEIGEFSSNGIAPAKKAYQEYYFLDKTGRPLNKKGFTSIVAFTEGICAIQETATSVPYLADTSLKKIADLSSVFEGPYSEGLAKSRNQSNKTTIYFLDRKGNVAITIAASDAYPFKEGRSRIVTTSRTAYFINRKGTPINGTTYTNALDFSQGLAAVEIAGKWGFIDTTGKLVISNQFDAVSSFQNGAAMVKSGEKYYQVNRTGGLVDVKHYEGAGNPANGSFIVKMDGKWGLIDSKGRTTIAFKYVNIVPLAEGMTWAVKEKKWGLVNSSGQELTPFIYDGAGIFKNGYAKVEKDGKLGLIDKAGKIVVPIMYDQMSDVYGKHVIMLLNDSVKTIAMP